MAFPTMISALYLAPRIKKESSKVFRNHKRIKDMKKIYIFDMDGTLTPSRREMTPDFEEFYSRWAKHHTFFLVSGSNLEKIKEQVPQYILDMSEGVFTCGGNQLWLGWKTLI